MYSPNSGRASNDAALHGTFPVKAAPNERSTIFGNRKWILPQGTYIISYVGENAGPRIQEHEINSSLYIVISVILKLALVLF